MVAPGDVLMLAVDTKNTQSSKEESCIDNDTSAPGQPNPMDKETDVDEVPAALGAIAIALVVANLLRSTFGRTRHGSGDRARHSHHASRIDVERHPPSVSPSAYMATEEDRGSSKDAAFIDGFLLGRWMATESRETSDGQPDHRGEWHSAESWCADESQLSEAGAWESDDGLEEDLEDFDD